MLDAMLNSNLNVETACFLAMVRTPGTHTVRTPYARAGVRTSGNAT
jgi:hypothetical protein